MTIPGTAFVYLYITRKIPNIYSDTKPLWEAVGNLADVWEFVYNIPMQREVSSEGFQIK